MGMVWRWLLWEAWMVRSERGLDPDLEQKVHLIISGSNSLQAVEGHPGTGLGCCSGKMFGMSEMGWSRSGTNMKLFLIYCTWSQQVHVRKWAADVRQSRKWDWEFPLSVQFRCIQKHPEASRNIPQMGWPRFGTKSAFDELSRPNYLQAVEVHPGTGFWCCSWKKFGMSEMGWSRCGTKSAFVGLLNSTSTPVSKQWQAQASKQRRTKHKQAQASKSFDWFYKHKIRKWVPHAQQHFLNEQARIDLIGLIGSDRIVSDWMIWSDWSDRIDRVWLIYRYNTIHVLWMCQHRAGSGRKVCQHKANTVWTNLRMFWSSLRDCKIGWSWSGS